MTSGRNVPFTDFGSSGLAKPVSLEGSISTFLGVHDCSERHYLSYDSSGGSKGEGPYVCERGSIS